MSLAISGGDGDEPLLRSPLLRLNPANVPELRRSGTAPSAGERLIAAVDMKRGTTRSCVAQRLPRVRSRVDLEMLKFFILFACNGHQPRRQNTFHLSQSISSIGLSGSTLRHGLYGRFAAEGSAAGSIDPAAPAGCVGSVGSSSRFVVGFVGSNRRVLSTPTLPYTIATYRACLREQLDSTGAHDDLTCISPASACRKNT